MAIQIIIFAITITVGLILATLFYRDMIPFTVLVCAIVATPILATIFPKIDTSDSAQQLQQIIDTQPATCEVYSTTTIVGGLTISDDNQATIITHQPFPSPNEQLRYEPLTIGTPLESHEKVQPGDTVYEKHQALPGATPALVKNICSWEIDFIVRKSYTKYDVYVATS